MLQVSFMVVKATDDEDEQLKERLSYIKEGGNYCDVIIPSMLMKEQCEKWNAILKKYKVIFTNVPECTMIARHDIPLINEKPIICMSYKVPYML